MIDNNTLLLIVKTLDNSAVEYTKIVNTFEQATIGTESLAEEDKNKTRMDALEIRCKNSQFLLERIIAALHTQGKDQAEIKPYENKVSDLLRNIREELNKNNLLGLIKHLEEIPNVMSEIDNEIKTQLQQSSVTLH